jgi:asparagine synthetase B (glutamine-hydrolysing)
MCEIVGIVKLNRRDTVEEARLKRMRDVLRHRGLTSLRAFGPLYRFLAGCGAAAQRVASAIARGWRGRSRAVSSSMPMAAGS